MSSPSKAKRDNKEILLLARSLICESTQWTTKAFARNQDGRVVHYASQDACKWCSAGAVSAAQIRLSLTGSPGVALHAAAREMGYDGYVVLNDLTDHATVLKMFDLAIEKCEQ